MNRDQTVEVLREASGLDRWLASTDPQSAQAMVDGWTRMLGEVPVDFAVHVVRGHYGAPDARSITPGDVLSAWRAHERRLRQQASDAQRASDVQQALDAAAPVVFGSGGQYLTDMVAAVARGEDPAGVPRPAGVRVLRLSPEAEARERACRFPDICVCTHLECRDGWLDEPATRTDQVGRSHEAVTRCPQCDDGLQMAQEQGAVRRPRRATR